ncbi:MAG TPA: helix-turn-helix transcriptional regulator [Dehalococcoidia bacterium]|jgi:transcriptional regulator with XRE-family HTH domain|nr:helix-turn-helix transcriptional regulator [Dehalococcoidia bacterium]
MSQLGDLIRRTRQRKGWTQDELAQKVGCKGSYIARIEKGRQRGSEELLFKIAKALDLNPQRVFTTAGITDVVFVPTEKSVLTPETYEFGKLDPKIRRLLLELAPILEKYLES